MKGEEFLGWLSDYQLLKKDPAPWSCIVTDFNGSVTCFLQ